MPKSNPAYLVRSPSSIFRAMRSILGFPPLLRRPGGLARVLAFAGSTLILRRLIVCVGDLDKNIHLLTDINGQRAPFETVDHLENTRIDSLGAAVARE